MRVHPIVYFLFKYAIWLVLVLIFAGIPVSFYFLRVNGIGFGAGEALGRALSTPSIDVRIGHLALDPFSGLLASDIHDLEIPHQWTQCSASFNTITSHVLHPHHSFVTAVPQRRQTSLQHLQVPSDAASRGVHAVSVHAAPCLYIKET